VLGQAWIAGGNKLATCGHVVEQYVFAPNTLNVKFPATGTTYPVKGIRLHPRFTHQPDSLVTFDVAVLFVELGYPERDVNPLPFQYGHRVNNQQSLSSIRYPAHLGQISGSPNALAQMGRLLGPLRKQDTVHLLHDLALAPGDSGAPIFEGNLVVAMHCGDTATMPILNLPTTAIRLAVSIDTLKELGIPETVAELPESRLHQAVSSGLWFSAVTIVTFVILAYLLVLPTLERAHNEQPPLLPVEVSFNKPHNQYQYEDPITISLTPRSNCWIYLFDENEDKRVLMLFPSPGVDPYVPAGTARNIGTFGGRNILVSYGKEKLHLVALKNPDPLLTDRDFNAQTPADSPLNITWAQLEERIEERVKNKPEEIFEVEIDAPEAQRGPDDKAALPKSFAELAPQ